MKKYFIFLACLLSLLSAPVVLAAAAGISTSQDAVAAAISKCKSAVLAVPLPTTCTGMVIPTALLVCQGGNQQEQTLIANASTALQKCIDDAEKNNADLVKSSDWLRFTKDWGNQLFWESKKTGFAAALKTSLSAFAKNFAYQTATWIASGGKGQKPLYITEGWGAYMSSALDDAAGTFLDTVAKNKLGVDICTPNFQVKLQIMTGIDWRAPQKARCSLSTIMNNWQSAITNADFALDYNNSFRPGENDISAYLMAETKLIDKTDYNLIKKVQEVSPDGYKAVTDWAGKILTPSIMVSRGHWYSYQQSNEYYAVFTNTVWDFVDTFISTLTGTLLQNLMSGFFSSSDSSGSSSSSSSSSYDVYNSDSSPTTGGIEGAKTRFLNIINNKEYTNGEKYDILSKLTTCTDQTRSNPGPTDCVMDYSLAQVIREKSLVMNIPDSILDRPFAPKIDQVTNPQTAFTLRNIMIMRAHRIVPVGWEIAAKYITQFENRSYTLRGLMAAYYDSSSPFYQLIDPFWVMKAPELFCRREGYGPDMSTDKTTVDRVQYCADEQQCIKEDDSGKCIAFGYCTEEKRVWDFSGTTCQPRFNTCQTFTSVSGGSNSYLMNTLDYKNCNAQNAGCKWYSTDFNPTSNYWGDASSTSTPYRNLRVCDVVGGCLVRGSLVNTWGSVSSDNKVIMNTPCSPSSGNYGSNGCNFSSVSCTIPYGGTRCQPSRCPGNDNLLEKPTKLNGDFSDCTDWSAKYWSLGYESSNKKHSCAAGGRSDNALQSYSIGNNQAITSTLSIPNLSSGSRYSLRFYAKGTMSNGSVSVNVFSGTVLNGITITPEALSTDWKLYEFEFDVQTAGTASIQVITAENSVGTVYFDDFELQQVNENCSTGLTWLTMGVNSTPSKTMTFFDGDVQTCSSDKQGCSQFIRIKGGLNSNVIQNPGFELPTGSDTNGPGWDVENYGANSKPYDLNASLSVSKDYAHSGQYSLKMSNIGSTQRGYYKNSSGAIVPRTQFIYNYTAVAYKPEANRDYILKAGKKYAFSGWIYYAGKTWAANDAAAINLYGLKDSPTVSIGLRLDPAQSDQWHYLSFIVDTTDWDADQSVNPRLIWEGLTENASIWWDDIKLEEIGYDATASSDYTDYNPTARPAEQLAYLKKAPSYYNCYATSTGKWPTNKIELASILNGKNPSCSNYSGVCIPEEVGCDLYKPSNATDPSIPATITGNDVCPNECVGYKTYLQEKTNFVSGSYRNFIANDTPKYCSAGYAGCDEFTNVDTLAKGGESLEYYSSLRACQKPQDFADGIDFYTWEGDDTTGYQLKSFKLKSSQAASLYTQAPCTNLSYTQSGAQKGKNYCKDFESISDITSRNATLGALLTTAMTKMSKSNIKDYFTAINEVGVTVNDSGILSQTLVNELHKYGYCVRQELRGYYNFNSQTNDIISINQNPDCREFYSVSGEVSYRLLSKTISISDNCHPYRRTPTQADSVTCPAIDNKVVSTVQCDCATSGGYWNDNNECIYMAIPGEGTTCPASFAKCRQYTGSHGNNTRNIVFDDFESGMASWNGGTLSSESTYPGGVSASATGIFKKNIFIKSGKSYTLSFWAKSNTPLEVKSIKFSGAPEANYFASDSGKSLSRVDLATTWQRYELGPIFVNWTGDGYQDLEFDFGGATVYVDNIILKQVTDDIYLIENSWFTPVACDNRLGDTSGTLCAGTSDNPQRCRLGEMVGCDTYTNSDSAQINLKSFNQLCRKEAVGCEALIDTHNSESPFAQGYNTGDAATVDDVTVPADEYVYLVNNAPNKCNAENMGCTAYGLPKVTNRDEVIGYSKVYLKNQPDRYTTDLCKLGELWCNAFSTGRSQAYFKDPRDKVCENKYQVYGTSTINRWVKKGSDEDCETSLTQTIGTGSAISKRQPVGPFDNIKGYENSNYTGWVGSCPTGSSSCTEYIDPLARMYTEKLYNGDFTQDVDGNKTPDGWSVSYANNTLTASTNVTLSSESMYTVAVTRKNTAENHSFALSCPGVSLWSPDVSMDNGSNGTVKQKAFSNNTDTTNSGRVYLEKGGSSSVRCTLFVNVYAGSAAPTDYKAFLNGKIAKVSLVPSGVYYNLDGTVDRSSCNGLVDFKTGCVLFNSRNNITYGDFSGASTRLRDNYLNFDADQTDGSQGKNPISPIIAAGAQQKNANDIIKVSPNRQCNTWLYCNTYEKGDSNKTSAVFGSGDKCLSLSSCSSLDEVGDCDNLIVNSNSNPSTVYSLQQLNKSGYSMLGYNKNGKVIPGYYPYEIMQQRGESTEVANGNFSSTIGETKEPLGWYVADDVDNQGWKDYKFTSETDIGNRQEGVSYLRLNSIYRTESEYIDVEPGKDYYVSAWINTSYLQPAKAIAKIIIEFIDTDGVYHQYGGSNIVVPAGLPWQHKEIKITIPNNAPTTDRVKIKLLAWNNTASGTCEDNDHDGKCDIGGYVLFDDVSLKPVLNVSAGATENDLLSRTCRVYPEQTSNSCKYITNNNVYYGWYGYCLLPDPQNKNICLQWWPVENPKGEILNEQSGYADRVPLYYCLKATMYYEPGLHDSGWRLPVINDDESTIARGDSVEREFNQVVINQPGPEFDWYETGVDESKYGIQVRRYGSNEWLPSSFMEINQSGGHRYFDLDDLNAQLNGDQEPVVAVDAVRIKCVWGDASNKDCEFYRFKYAHVYGGIYCDEVVKAVTETGVNRAWSSRVEKGSAYTLPPARIPALFAYQSDTTPFGSIYPPEPQNDPRRWNGSAGDTTKNGRLTIYGVGDIGSNVRSGIPYSINVVTDGSTNMNINDFFGRCSVTHSLCAIGAPGFMGCDSNEVCEKVSYDINNRADGINLLKRIFADYYGLWTWQSYDNNNKCAYTSSSKCSITDTPCSKASDCKTDYGLCNRTTTIATCNGGIKNGNSCSNINDPSDCRPKASDCTAGMCGNNTDFPENRCTTYADCWNFYRASSYGVCKDGVCQGGPSNGAICGTDNTICSDANKATCQNVNVKVCAGADVKCSSNSECILPTNYCKGYCTKSGVACRVISSGTSSSNSSDCGGSGYVLSTSTKMWGIPEAECAHKDNSSLKYLIRPSEESLLANYYCYITPRVTNILVNNSTAIPVIISKGVVKLSFNAEVDPDQLPLREYSIAWKDGTTNTISGATLHSRVEQNYTFDLYHYYDYWQIKATSRAADYSYCYGDTESIPADIAQDIPEWQRGGTGWCALKVGISIKDNWNKRGANVSSWVLIKEN